MAFDTDIEICNAALFRAGVTKRIESLTAQSKEADACELEYLPTVELVQEDHPWQFLMKYTTLSADTATPEWEWAYQYTLPNDFLTMQNLEAEEIPYEIVGDGKLMTDEPAPLKIRYTALETDPTKWPMAFKQALITKLASLLCIGLTKDEERSELLSQKYEKLIADARFFDQNRRSYQPLDSSGFVDARTVGPEAINIEGNLNG